MGNFFTGSSTSSESDDSGYGNIKRVQTSGASWETAKGDRQTNLGLEHQWTDSDGRKASHVMAENDAGRMKNYRSKINNVGREYGIDPALIAAIISRESRAGEELKNGWGDYSQTRQAYNAWGLMQVDVDPKGGNHTPQGAWDSEEHLSQATGILVDFIKKMQDKFSGLSKEKQLKGGIAAYNKGDGNVHTYGRVDEYTTGKDYSNDVVARAQWYKEHGY